MADAAFYTAWAEVAPDFSKFGRKVDRGFKDALEPAGRAGGDVAGKGMRRGVLDSVRGLAGPLAAAFGALSIGNMISDSISQASDLAEAGTAISEVFGSQDKAIREFAKAGATAFGENEISVLRAAQSFGIYGKAAGLAGGDLTAFSTDMVALGTDLASFFNTDTQTAINAIGAGLRGEAEPLRQFGVLLDDATLKARAMEMGIFAGKGALTQQQRVLAAQAEILAQTSTAQGDFARTSSGLANQQRILAASWSDIVTQMGSFFLPIATTIVTFINSNVIPAIQGFLGTLQGGGGGFAGFISSLMGMRDALIRNVAEAFPEILTAVVSGMSSLISTVVDVLPDVVNAVVAAVPMIVDGLVAAIPLLVVGAVQLLTGIIEAVGILVPQLVTAVVGLIPTIVQALITVIPLLINGAIQLFTALVNAIPLIIPQLVTAIMDLLPVLLNALVTLIPALIQGAVNLFIAIVQAIPVIIPALIEGIVGLLPTLIETIIGLIPVLIEAAVQLFTALIDAIPVIIPALIDTLIEVGPQLVEAILGIIPQLFDAGKAIIQGLIDGIGSMFGAIGDAVGGVMDYIGGFFPHSPAKRGPFSGSGWNGLKKSGGALYSQFVDGFNGGDPELPALSTSVRVPRPPSLDELEPAGVAGRSGINVQNHFASLDPVVAIRQMSDDLSFAVGVR